MEHLTDNPNEIAVLRARLHGMANDVQTHGVKIELHSLELTNMKAAFKELADTTATGDQLESASAIMQLKLDRMGDGVKTVVDDVATMKGAFVWGVRLVVGAVILAVIALVVK